MRSVIRLMSLGLFLSVGAACNSGEKKVPAGATPAATLPAEATPGPGGKFIEIVSCRSAPSHASIAGWREP